MAHTTIKRIREFIEMYQMTDVLTISTPPNTSPAYEVSHKINKDDYNVYLCKTLIDASCCVNDIIFDLPLEHDVEIVEANE